MKKQLEAGDHFHLSLNTPHQGFCFIYFENSEARQRPIDKEQLQFNGRELKIASMQQKSKRPRAPTNRKDQPASYMYFVKRRILYIYKN